MKAGIYGCITLVLGAWWLVAGCGGPGERPAQGGRLRVTCTTGMVADLARNVGGERVEVDCLMGPCVDPHYYKASQGDLERLSRAGVILYNGLFLEGKMEEIFGKMAREKRVVAVAGELPAELLRKPPEFDGHFDPHVWFDVSLWRQTIPTVVAALTAADPAGAEEFKRQGAAYAARLDTLHQWVQQQIATIPAPQRVLVTAHDAFGYFGRAYGVEVLGLQGVSTVAEYGVNDVNRLVDLIVGRRLKAIFVESSVPQRSINAVREGCQGRGHQVQIGGTLYSDAMGEPGSGADTYEGMVRANVYTIAAALQ